MNVGALCNREVVIAHPQEKLLDAVRRMRTYHVGTLVVVNEQEKRQPIGILTDRDVTIGAVAQAPEDLHRLLVRDVMSDELVTARQSEDLEDVVRRMTRAGVRRVPVVDETNILQGILALDDLFEYVAEQVEDFVRLMGRERRREEARRI